MEHGAKSVGRGEGLRLRFLAHLVVVGQDQVEGAGGSEQVLAFFAGAGEGGEDVFNIVALEAVEQEISSVELGHEVGTFVGFPFMDGRVETSGLGQGNHVITGAGQLKNPLGNPLLQGLTPMPRTTIRIKIRGKHRKLLDQKKIKINVSDFLSCNIIERECVKIGKKTALFSYTCIVGKKDYRSGIYNTDWGNE